LLDKRFFYSGTPYEPAVELNSDLFHQHRPLSLYVRMGY